MDQGVAYWIRRPEGQGFLFFCFASPAVGGVGIGGCAVRVGLWCMHRHVVFQHSTAGHILTVPVSTGGH